MSSAIGLRPIPREEGQRSEFAKPNVSLLLPDQRPVPEHLSQPQPLRLPPVEHYLDDIRREAGHREQTADIGVRHALLLREVGDRLRATALDLPAPSVRAHEPPNQGLVPRWVVVQFNRWDHCDVGEDDSDPWENDATEGSAEGQGVTGKSLQLDGSCSGANSGNHICRSALSRKNAPSVHLSRLTLPARSR
jgi:hypothetical protein